MTNKPFFEKTEIFEFKSRPNRFVLIASRKGKEERLYLPNPGRLRELLFPGVSIWAVRNKAGSLPYTAVAVQRDGLPVMLHTHVNNAVAEYLIRKGSIPALRGYSLVRREVKVGHSRFDCLLSNGRKELLLEVKSCTLFGDKIAMFPDAVTARGTRHLLELAQLSRNGIATAVLFIVHTPGAKYFMPDFHTDPVFASTLHEVKDRVTVIAAAVSWRNDLSLRDRVSELPIPWDIVEKENHDKGSYLVVLRLKKRTDIEVGALGGIRFEKGYYVYAGSAMQNLRSRVERHKSLRKNKHWHIDYLREKAEFIDAFPIRASERLECELARAIGEMSDGEVKGFGCSDCDCGSHLFRCINNPQYSPEFIKLLLHFRIDRLENYLR